MQHEYSELITNTTNFLIKPCLTSKVRSICKEFVVFVSYFQLTALPNFAIIIIGSIIRCSLSINFQILRKFF
jgi:hypothetical protein